jgi:hypothetical protein
VKGPDCRCGQPVLGLRKTADRFAEHHRSTVDIARVSNAWYSQWLRA